VRRNNLKRRLEMLMLSGWRCLLLRVRKSATFRKVKNDIGGADGDSDPTELPDLGVKQVAHTEH
jgi:hypothetical protein